MGNIHLTLACEDYDRTRPLKDGRIKPEGIELNYLVLSVEEIFWRMMKYEEFDASELSMGAFLTAAAQGRRPFIAIPVFPSRTFRHRCIFINTGSDIERPQDLRGKRMLFELSAKLSGLVINFPELSFSWLLVQNAERLRRRCGRWDPWQSKPA